MHHSRRIFRTAVALPLAALMALLALVIAPPTHAQVCPFDDGNSTLAVDGLILTRYALGITGAPLVAGTDINAVDAPTVEATINCPSCGLNITGNPTMTVADATIISRKLAGFSGAALTNGLNLGTGTRSTVGAVNSFLLAGCGTTGGTVTSVTAGTGLTGGTITGSGTIAVNPAVVQTRVNGTCAVGSSIRSIAEDGTVTCQTTTGGSGTVASVATGAGLTGGPITGSGTINLAATQLLPTLACATNQVARWSGTAWVCAAVASLVADAVQLKPQTLRRSNIDVANTGLYSSTTIGVDGFPIIAFYDQANQNLKVAHCDDIQCSTSTSITVDSAGDVGKFPSITIDTNGLAAISYYDQSNGALKIAFCADIVCSAASIAAIDTNNNVGQHSSIAVAGNLGLLTVSYYDATVGDLKIAQCNNRPCTTAATYTFGVVDTAGDVGKWSAIAYGGDNSGTFDERIVIAYFDATSKTVKLAFCTNSTCSAPTFAVVETLGTDTADGISMVLSQNNAPILSYYKRASATSAVARIAVCDSPDCGAPLLRSAGSTSFREQLSSITVGRDGLPIAAFGAGVADCNAGASGTQPRVMRCVDATCSAMSAVFTSSFFGQSPSMTIGVDGVPFISQQQCAFGGSRLGVLHCSDAGCNQGYRRR